ncbi:MAG: hypothetical protein H6604_01195 [Flavobacteriales bacterium]|nr:hypothetical protein [Flavobacteriales bacterium]
MKTNISTAKVLLFCVFTVLFCLTACKSSEENKKISEKSLMIKNASYQIITERKEHGYKIAVEFTKNNNPSIKIESVVFNTKKYKILETIQTLNFTLNTYLPVDSQITSKDFYETVNQDNGIYYSVENAVYFMPVKFQLKSNDTKKENLTDFRFN